jgi:serine protease Do
LRLRSKKGALIASIETEGAAAKAGLKQYDVIVAINGQPVENMNDLRLKIADNAPNSKVEVTVIRDGKEKVVTAVLDELDEEAAKGQAVSSDKDIGLSLTAMSPSLARRSGYRTGEGLLVTEVRPYSEAARRGLQEGDIILEVNRHRISSVSEFEGVLKRTASGDYLMLLVRRESDGSSQDTVLTLRLP